MIQNIFKRFEQKYILTEEQFLSLQDMLEKHFNQDKFYKSKIYNIYFDNDNYDLIINSIEKPKYKEKVRLRSYMEVDNNDLVFLEVKQKYKKIVYKRRISLTLNEFNEYLKNGIINGDKKQIMNEIDYRFKFYNLKPKIFVAYDRLSYYSKDDINFRMTFDTNLRSRMENLSLKDSIENNFYFSDKKYLMEVKTMYGLPKWFVDILTLNKIYPQSFSKVGNIYQKEKGVKVC